MSEWDADVVVNLMSKYSKEVLEVQSLKAELKREREAVDFYADPMNWYLGEDDFSNIKDEDMSLSFHDDDTVRSNTGGKKAREAQKLREIKL